MRTGSDFKIKPITSELCALFCLLLGSTVLLGWYFDIGLLKTIQPYYISMKANTAFMFLIMGLALLLLQKHEYNVLTKFFIFSLCLITITVSIGTLAEYLLNVNYGIDEFLFLDPAKMTERFPPGRPAPITAVCFFILSTSLLLTHFARRPWLLTAQLFTVFAFLAAFQGLIGYAIGMTYVFGSTFYSQMALHTSLGLIFLSFGCLTSRGPRQTLGEIFRSTSPASLMIKKMLLGVILVPPVMRLTSDFGLRFGYFDQEFIVLLQLMGSITLLAGLVLFSSRALLKFEVERGILTLRESEANQSARRSQILEQSMAKKLRIITDAIPALVSYIDVNEVYLFANQTYEKWFGVPASGIVGKKIANVLGIPFRNAVFPRIQQVIKTGQSLHVDGDLVQVSGRPVAYHADYIPDIGPNGEVVGCVVLCTDISDQKKIQKELQSARSLAEVANLAKSSFLANMSHEIRTPLGAIIGFSDLLKSSALSKDQLADYIAVIDRNSNHLLRIIDDILDLSKVEAGKMEVESIQFSLDQLLSDFSALIGYKAREKGIDFRIVAETQLPDLIISDPTRLRQILLNVVGNAIKFTTQGEVIVNVSVKSCTLEISVSDTGPGIFESEMDKLFQPFHQADASTTRIFGGTGLGLALTRRLASALGGKFFLKDTLPGRGSVFMILIPITIPDNVRLVNRGERTQGAEKSLLSVADAGSFKGMNILVVEDAPDNQTLMNLILTKAGATVTIAKNGVEGVEYALKNNYDVILMDIQMPLMDGYEATYTLRNKNYQKPIIALTAHAMKEERQLALKSGFNDFLTKPIQRDQLFDVVKRYQSQSMNA